MLKDCLEELRRDDGALLEGWFEGEELTAASAARLDCRRANFTRCRFVNCDFSRASFEEVQFVRCDFSGCRFGDTYWKNCRLGDCKGEGADWSEALLRGCHLNGNGFRYANFYKSRWEDCVLEDCGFREGNLSETRFRRVAFRRVDFGGVDFFHTPLKGLELSDCDLGGIVLSDTFSELRGAKISALQAIDLVTLLGVTIQ